jgi:hypothetical protein
MFNRSTTPLLPVTSRDLRWRFRLRKSCVRGQSRRAEPERKSRLVRGEARRDFPLTVLGLWSGAEFEKINLKL